MRNRAGRMTARKTERPQTASPFDFGDGARVETGMEASDSRNAPDGEETATETAPVKVRSRRKRGDAEDVALYRSGDSGRSLLDNRVRTTVILLVVAIVLVPVTLVLPTHLLGGHGTSIAQFGASLGGRISAASQIGQDTAAGMAMSIYLFQAIAVALVGAGLAMNGAVYQGAMRNALDPVEYFLQTQQRVLFTAVGSFAVVALVLVISFAVGRGRVSKVGLLVAGQVFATVITSVVEMVRFYVRDNGTESQMDILRLAVGGSFEDITSLYQVMLLGVPIVVGIAVIMALRNRLNLLAFDDDEIKTLGMNVNLMRNGVIAVCTALTAVIVAFVGNVGFVGFIVPHVARMMVGPDSRFLIPASICLGAIYLLGSFALMNMTGILMGSVGTFTSLIGIVFFAVLVTRERARGNADWL